MGALRPALLLIASISFGLGISLPLIRLEKFFFFSDTPSLVELVFGLWQNGDIGLSLLVGLFSLVFPVIKLFTVYEAAYGSGNFPAWASVLAKWSMMDVLLVAILVFAAKTSGLATAVSQPGIWFYALSTVAAATATAGIKNASNVDEKQ
ncbi:MAG: paraquat-inducible protein A [Pseudomonadota bacterium]